MRCLPIAVIAAASTITFTHITFAADMPVKAPVARVAISNWTGWYAGVNGGYGWHQSESALISDGGGASNWFTVSGVPQTADPSFDLSGWLVGAQAGYNYQTAPNWLIGVETDIQGSWIKGEGAAPINTVFGPLFNDPPWEADASTKIKWFGTLRARAGYLPTSNLLFYLTGGLAYGGVERTAKVINTFLPLGGSLSSGSLFCLNQTVCYAQSETRTDVGWTVGAGAEYMFSGRWSLKAEYLHVEFGGHTFVLPATQPPGTATMIAAFDKTRFDLFRMGLNYKFN